MQMLRIALIRPAQTFQLNLVRRKISSLISLSQTDITSPRIKGEPGILTDLNLRTMPDVRNKDSHYNDWPNAAGVSH